MFQQILLHRKIYGNLPVSLLRTLISRTNNSIQFGVSLTKENFCELSDDVSIKEKNEVFIDVTEFCKFDARTGIQRVVRSVVDQISNRSFSNFNCRLVCADLINGFTYFDGESKGCPVNPRAGDIFFGLDLSSQLVPHLLPQIARWKSLGVRISFMVYDLLPLTNPEYFRRARVRHFNRWIKAVVATADVCICISKSVENSLREWIGKRFASPMNEISIAVIPMGANFAENCLTDNVGRGIETLVQLLRNQSWVLMVGTLEPRKAHQNVLEAFEEIWKRDKKIPLVLVGKPGWSTLKLQNTIRSHSEFNRNLFWLDSVSDHGLNVLYAHATGVMVPSFAEGFGLPIIEANRYRKPVLARDIPVFREVGGDAATYFSLDDALPLADSIIVWIENLEQPEILKLPTWKDTADGVVNVLGLN